MHLPDRLYVTGTDTDVGKTIVSAALCAAHGHAYWKPVQAGLQDATDSETVASLAPEVRVHREAHRLTRPASPHAAADDDGVVVDPKAVAPTGRLLVEGAGGWRVPFGVRDGAPVWQTEIVAALGLPVLVVARAGLGTLNHTFLTLEALRHDGLEVLGLVLVGPPHPENARDLARWGAPVLAQVPRVALPEGFASLVDAVSSPLG